MKKIAITTLIVLIVFSCREGDTAKGTDFNEINITTNSSCSCEENEHSRICKNILIISKGEHIDSLIDGEFGKPINYRQLSINNRSYLFTENVYFGNYGYEVGIYNLYSLSETTFMKPVLKKNVVLRQEMPNAFNKEYTHYVNEKTVDIDIKENIVFDICSFVRVCPEAQPDCDTILKSCTSESYFFSN